MLNKFGLSRLLLWFNFIILIVGLTSGAVFFMTSKKSVTQLTETSISGLDRLSAKSSLLKSVAAIQSNIIATVAEQDKDSRDIRLEVISGLMSEADKFFKSCGTACKELQSVFDNYEKNWQTIQTEKLAKNDLNGATQDTISKLSPLAESLIDKLDKELIETKKLTESNFNEAVEQNHKAQMAVAAIILFSNIFMLALGLFFRKSIIANFNKLTSRLNISSSHTFEMSQYLSKTSEDINRSTDNQSSAVQEIVASLDEINAMASKNAETADTALNCSNDTTTVVTNGQHAVTDMISIMDEINAVNKNMETFVSANNNQLEQIVNLINSINEKTKVINDIVFQTKLLSFNASVEAARAGEHGKGFAVVAEEVGGLAQMSGNAAKEISELVQSSLSQVKDIVDKSKENVTRIVNENSEKISLGGERANACGNVLNEIHHNVSTLNELLKTVVTATQEQKQGINEIGVGMRQVDGATQQNKTATENLKENSTELRNEASTLKELTQDIVFTIMGHSSESSSLLRTPTSSTNRSQDNHDDSEWDERKSA